MEIGILQSKQEEGSRESGASLLNGVPASDPCSHASVWDHTGSARFDLKLGWEKPWQEHPQGQGLLGKAGDNIYMGYNFPAGENRRRCTCAWRWWGATWFMALEISQDAGRRGCRMSPVPCQVNRRWGRCHAQETAAFGRNQRGPHAMDNIKGLWVRRATTATSSRWDDRSSSDCLMLLELRTLNLGPSTLFGDPPASREEWVLHGVSFR